MISNCFSSALLLASCLIALPAPAQSAAPQRSFVRGWGSRVFDSAWRDTRDFVGIAAGGSQTLARRSDGSVVGWGDNSYRQLDVPALPPGLTYVELATSRDHSVARRSDGSVVAWGDNSHGQLDDPALSPGLYVAVMR